MSRNGAHHAALRRRSVKVFEGAMKVSMMRAPWDSGAGTDADTGESGAVAMFLPPTECERILSGRRRRHKGRVLGSDRWPALSGQPKPNLIGRMHTDH